MALTSGTRQLLREVLSWGVVAVIAIAALTHFENLKVGAERMLGLPTPADVAQARQQAADSNAPRQNATAAAAQQPTASGTVVELAAQDNGHFNTHAEINGRPVEVMVDTGATMVALSYEDAERAGLYLRDQDFTRSVHTANGVARVAPVTLDRVSIGGITVRNVPAAVTEPGRLKTSLLGMSFLSRLSRFDMRQGRLVLQE
ncbi:TIGR02281 family clan AA aspartic protease [Hyphomicrobium sp. D-2]|uniref:retropepsin-like aspartic protease family protein n=1 Tax=Hyphomicrobium sp. D-2 TaxID=3041621 RepID=UPI002453C9D5|nr:TIGR02281 family clan AA aspartic protease [Hyphomicrobium sp. D-2]MDH4981551.1 TIGR02281 family clan AA aspartic protease [Hyphomicrobium sp. D-2]